MISICRALNIPARLATGIDYGADPALGPTDFHCYVEAYLGDRWYVFDPSGISPRMGLLRIGLLNRSFGPRRVFGQAPVGGLAAKSPLAALALGGVFAVAHTPCVGPTLGAILGLSVQMGAAPQVILLLLGYSLGIGIPFIVLALAMDGSARLTRPFLRHGRKIELIGGGLVVLIGLAIVFDFLSVFARYFSFLWPRI